VYLITEGAVGATDKILEQRTILWILGDGVASEALRLRLGLGARL
jgi:hypothetical protein